MARIKGGMRQTVLQQQFIKAVNEAKVPHEEIARLTGFSYRYICNLMAGDVHGSLPAWEAILDAVDVQVGTRRKVRNDG